MVYPVIQVRATGQTKTSGTTVDVTLTNAVPVGHSLLAAMSFDNLTATTPSMSAPSKPTGETANWVEIASFGSPVAGAANGVRGGLWRIDTTVEWPSSTVVTFTVNDTVAAKCAAINVVSDLNSTFRSVTTFSGTTSSVSNVLSTETDDFFIGVLAVEANTAAGVHLNVSGTTYSLGGAWVNTTGGGSAANQSLAVDTYIPGNPGINDVPQGSVTASSSTSAATGDCAGVWLIFAEKLVVVLGSATLDASASLTAAGVVIAEGAATLDAASTLTAAGVVERFGDATLDASATLTSSATAGPPATEHFGAAVLAATATLTAAGAVWRIGSLSPDTLLTQTNMTGAVATLQDDPDSPDANWMSASGGNIELRVGFELPGGNLRPGAGYQQIRLLVRAGA